MKQLHVVGGYPVGTHTFVLWQFSGARKLGHQCLVLAANTGNESGYLMARQLGLDDVAAIYANYRTSSPWRADPGRFTPAIWPRRPPKLPHLWPPEIPPPPRPA